MRKEFTLKSLAKEEKIGIFEEGNDKPLTDIEIVKLLNTYSKIKEELRHENNKVYMVIQDNETKELSIFNSENHKEYVNFFDICDLLNECNHKKEQLKYILDELIYLLKFDLENGVKEYCTEELMEDLLDKMKEIE